VKSNQGKYGGLVQELAKDFNKGRDSYPDTLTAAYELMLHDVRDQDSRHPPHGDPGLAFNTVKEGTSATNTQPNPRPDVTCHKCGKLGHFSNKCAEVSHAKGTVFYTMVQEGIAGQPPDADDTGGGVAMAHLGSVDDDADSGWLWLILGVWMTMLIAAAPTSTSSAF
jgi:hypothetical protein